MDVIIRAVQVDDIPDMLKMNNEFNDVDCATVESMRESLEKNKNELVFIAVNDGKAIGFICAQLYSSICYTSKQGEITELFVSKSYRRKGIATMLVNHLEFELIKNNVHEITIITGMKNFNAQKLYEKCGYVHRRMAYVKSA